MNNARTYVGLAIYSVVGIFVRAANFISEKYSNFKWRKTNNGVVLKNENVHGKFRKRKVVFRLGNKWYWDIRLWTPAIVVLFFLLLNGMKTTEVKYIEIPVYDSVMVENAEGDDDRVVEEKIVSMARLADSVAKGRPDVVKEIILWVLVNRVEDKANGYGKTLMEEISRPRQWQGYDAEAVYLDSTYQLAKKVYQTWQSGGARPIYPDMLWFVLNGDGSVTVRNQYKEGKNRVEATFGQ